MNINKLTIGQAKELMSIFGDQKTNSSLQKNYIGKYVIVRSRNEGLNAGFLVDADETGCILKDARRLWHHKPIDTNESWYEGVSQKGLHPDSRISMAVKSKIIIEDYSITLCSSEGANSIQSAASHAQN